MNAAQVQERRIREEAEKRLAAIRAKPLKVAVIGGTGNGKSSHINALTGATLPTDAVRPCTKAVSAPVSLRSKNGHQIDFHDLPGIGEAAEADERYLEMYADSLAKADMALWLIHADSRSVTAEIAALNRLLAAHSPEVRRALLNKVTLALSKCDLLASPPWICARAGAQCTMVPQKSTQQLFEAKGRYFADALLKPFAGDLRASTYRQGDWRPKDSRFRVSDTEIVFDGFLSEEVAADLKQRDPVGADAIDRLTDNHRVIPFSSLFRFNLCQLLSVVVNKMGTEAVQRFQAALGTADLNQLPFTTAVGFGNLLVLDTATNKVVFDLARHTF